MLCELNVHVCHLGCSAAVLALRYGHIECANQITHRDCDEFFVIPRPLSIYETPPTITQPKTKSRKKNKSPTPAKADLPLSALSFGLLKIIFNESDSSYSTRLAAVCKKEKSGSHRRRKRAEISHGLSSPKTTLDSAKSTVIDEIHYCSTEALVNELQRATLEEARPASPENHSAIPNSGRTSPRLQLLMQQYSIDKSPLITDESYLINSMKTMSKAADDSPDVKSKLSLATVPKQTSNSTLNYFEENLAQLQDASRIKLKPSRPRTAVARPPTSTNAVGVPSRLSSAKSPSSHSPPATSQPTRKKKALLVQRAHSASTTSKQQPSNIPSEISNYSQTLYAGRPLSAAVQHYPLPVAQASDSSCAIREARGPTRRFNKPEEVFGLKPEQLFGSQEQHAPKLMDQRQLQGETRLKRSQRQAFVWQDDVDKLVDLYNIHHSSNYRTPAVPPLSSTLAEPVDTVPDLIQITRNRKTGTSRNSQTSGRTPKLSTLASLNIPRRNSISQRQAIKVAHT